MKATGKGRRDIDDELDQHDVRAFREVAVTRASSTGASSTQFVTFVVHAGETWVFNYQPHPKTLYVYTDTDGAVVKLTRKSVPCTVQGYDSHILDCSAESWIALAYREAESHGIVRRLPEAASSWRVRVAPPWITQW